MGAIIMDNAVIGENSIIAAGSVVLENTIVEPDSVFGGVPARFLKKPTRDRPDTISRIAKATLLRKLVFERCRGIVMLN
jgi:gamma-carbonic anhydrase